MPEPYRIVVGLEVHVQLLTRSKLFCGCSTKFGARPNSQTCPVCLGMPGSLPVMNRDAFRLALRAALALNCRIAPFTKWDRKNYYYPDLPKNYQISQYDLPFSHDGWLEIETPAGPRKVGIIRAHLEEDAGKSIHDESGRGGETKVDLNRTGTPLVEIVSQPEINGPDEAKAYLEEMRLLMRELGVSDCEMQEGSLRCDANVNVHIPIAGCGLRIGDSEAAPAGASGSSDPSSNPQPATRNPQSYVATPVVEVKNLNSISAVGRAIQYEAARQFREFTDPASPGFGVTFRPGTKTTRGWNDAAGRSYPLREKEEASDYRYFPDPDLVPVVVTEAELASHRAGLGELPAAQRKRLQQPPYSLSPYDAGVLTAQGRALVAYYEAAAQTSGDPKAAANWITNEVLASLKERGEGIDRFPLSADRLAGLIGEQKAGLPREKVRKIYAHLLEHGSDIAAAKAALGIGEVVSDENQLREIVRRAIAANPQAAEDFRKGKVKAADRIKGAVMKETKGTAKADVVQRLLMEELSNQ